MPYFVLAALVIVADQLTKLMILNSFHLYESREVIPGFFNLVYVTNPGAAFSLFADIDSPWRHYFFLGIGLVAVVGLTIGYFAIRKEHKWYMPAFACIAGGAAGNLIDRVRFGSVVDFLDVYVGKYHWPAFNIADSAICIGAAIFITISLLQSKKN
ncbi:signal peptidase II [Desulfosediminicola flagellatus]|uniref:signal peptidase II n=1 Tax=Desulfosediminicola flagellatus TaxID=2569541 RepID=UPI001E428850|nr:signal peptidase II [Desulfosediminicola flagellatus]